MSFNLKDEEILELIPKMGWTTARQLAERKQKSVGNLTIRLNKLCKKGLLIREKNPEGYGNVYQKV